MTALMDRPTQRPPVRRGRRSLSVVAALVAGLLALTGCTPEPADDAASPGVEIPDSPVGARAEWALDLVNAEAPVAPDDLDGDLSPAMLEAVTLEEFAAALNSIRESRPWTATDYVENGANAEVRLESYATDPLQMKVAVDEAGLVDGLLFSPVPAEREAFTTWDELTGAVDGLPAATTLTVTHLTDGDETEPVFTAGDTGAHPMGSMVKLWVLAAVADAVKRGDLTWDTKLTVTDDLRSLPSGELQDAPAGTEVSVEDAALKMISISDNTAMDLLINAVGRDAVEQTFAKLGQQDPGLNVPLLTSREAFQVGWTENGALRDAWFRGDDDVRRAVIAGLPGGVVQLEAQDVTTPAWQQGIDWFASAHDLVLVHTALQARAATPSGAPIREILGANPGLPFGDEWSYVAYKGGSVVGVLGGSWLLEREDGERYVITLQAASTDPAAVADVARYFGLVEDAAAILAAQ